MLLINHLARQQALTSGLGFLQPDSIQKFQDPFQDQVIDVAMRELDRQADMQKGKIFNKPLGSWCFWWFKRSSFTAETDRGLQQVKGDTLSKLLSQGFGQALKASQEAGRLSGGLGQAFGTLAGHNKRYWAFTTSFRSSRYISINTIRCFKTKTTTSRIRCR